MPQQDTGQLIGFVRGDDGLSFSVMQPKMETFRRAAQDPAVESVAGFIGGNNGTNNAVMLVRLKPISERKISAQKGHRAPAQGNAQGAGRAPVPDGRPGPAIRRRPRPDHSQYSYILQSGDLAACASGTRKWCRAACCRS
jgi:multidrug efflux pump